MQRFADSLNRAYNRHGGRWLISAALAGVCMALTFALFKVTFLNNDDANILYALAGYRSGAPYPTHRFINVALGLLISGLYRAAPSIPWWTVCQLTMLFAALTVIGACALKLADRALLPLWAALGLIALLYMTVFVYPVAWIAFTLTAGMLGTAACALIVAIDWERDARLQRRASAAGAVALLLLCFFTRNSSGYSMLCFAAAAALYQLIKAPVRMRVRVACALAAGVAAAALAVCLNNWGVARYNPPYYAEFEAARGHFIDYPHVTYEEDPAFFASLGWDKTIYDLADNLCYLDTAVNAETMNAIAAYPYAEDAGMLRRLAGALAYGEAFFRGSGVSQYMLAVPVLLTLWLLALCIRRRGKSAELPIACAVAAGAFLLCFYLCFAGRFPVHTFMLIAIPTTVMEWLLLLCMWGEKRTFTQNKQIGGEKRKYIARYLQFVGIFLTSAAVAWSLGMTQKTLFDTDRTALVEQNAAAETYAMEHPDNIYLTDVTSLENIGAFTVYPEEKPVNLIDWGGTGMHSGWKEAQLAANGLASLSAGLFRQENVYFITAVDSDKLAMLDAYLTAHAGAVGYTCIEPVADGLAAYRFSFDGGEGGR